VLVIYNIAVVLLSIVLLPYLLYRGFAVKKHRVGLRQRFGIYPREVLDRISGKPLIWIQAVSVGEVLAVRHLTGEIRRRFPGYQLLISTTTLTGQRICREKVAADSDIVIYFPLDYPWVVRKALRRFRPSLIVLVETEIWPNFICMADRMGVPVVLVNGRISYRSFKGYMRYRWFIRHPLGCLSWVGMQTKGYAERIIAMGADPGKVRVIPSLKYEGALQLAEKKHDEGAIRKELLLGSQSVLLTAGSTHSGEEEVLAQVYLQLKDEFPNLVLLLAPRHPERVPEITTVLTGLGISCNLKSELSRNAVEFRPVIILDTLGELIKYYAISAIVFVGKSLCSTGGQNPLEPAVLGKPVVFGPHMGNFEEASELLAKNRAALVVSSADELAVSIRQLLQHPDEARKMGARARAAMQKMKGAVEETIGLMSEVLAQDGARDF
jgi:3-deoxy-D-manno-octulosonic-acid transferase